MADKEPLLFRVALGVLRPINGASEDALRAIPTNSTVRIEIKRTAGNVKRMAWYWVMLKVALDNLPDAFDGPISTMALHRWLKREFGLAKPITSKRTGEVIDYDYESISFATMPENERAAFIDQVTDFLSRRLEVDAHTLKTEARTAA